MFNIKRALTATALTTALAGGILGLGAISAEASTAGVSASAVTTAPKCLWVGGGHKLKFHTKNARRVNKATIKYNFDGKYWTLKRTRGCEQTNYRYW